MVIVLLNVFNGIVEEHIIGHAFEEALPFTALLVVFFAIVAVIHELHLFSPAINYVLAMDAGYTTSDVVYCEWRAFDDKRQCFCCDCVHQ
jgi:Na+/H+ antiporter NhaB